MWQGVATGGQSKLLSQDPCRTTACSRRPPASATLPCDQRARWSHTIKARKDKKGSAGKPDPAASRCPYPDVLRSHPRCEALGTTVHKREASSGRGPGEDAKDEHV